MPFMKVNGTTIKYEEYGDRKYKHVLFLHGLGSSSIVWRDIPVALSEYFHTMTIDLVGFGRSEKPETADYTIKGFSKLVMDFLKERIGINTKKKIIIVGHSLGGYIAAEFAIDNKDLVEKIILIDSSGMLKEPTALLEQYLDAAVESDSQLKHEKIKRVFEDMLADRSRLLPVFIDIFIKTIKSPGAEHAFKSTFYDSTSKEIGSERLDQIKDIPCLIIWGEYDKTIPPDHANKFKNVLTNARLEIIRDAGHAPFMEKTALVYDKIRTFLINNDMTM